MPDLVVVHSPIGGGHRAAATAIAEAAGALGHSVVVLDAFQGAPSWARTLYTQGHLFTQRYLPTFIGGLYFATNRVGGGLEPLRHGIERCLFGGLVGEVQRLQPRAIVSTHHIPSLVLAKAKRDARIDARLTTVVTDYVAHGFWVEAGTDRYAAPSLESARELVAHGAPAKSISVTGIPVRAAFDHIDAPLAIEGRPLRVLVTTGGFGVGPARAILRSFRGIGGVELVVIAGNNEQLRRSLDFDARLLGLAARIVGFEADMPSRVAWADVVVGKAGGLTVSEAMTAGRALVLVGSVPGNETVNERIILREEAGVAAKPSHVGAAISSMRHHFRELGARGRAFVRHDAARAVVELSLAKELGPSQGSFDAKLTSSSCRSGSISLATT